MNDSQKIEKYHESGIVNPSDNFLITKGPSYLEGVPSDKEWLGFINKVENLETKEFTNLWREKSKIENGVPLRRDFDFRSLVKFGKNLVIYKFTEEGRWFTTFCGDNIVEETNLELSNKYIDEYADENTLKYWMENIQLITEQHMPVFENYTLEYSKKDHKTSLAINLPLRSGADDSIDMIICHESFLYL